MKNNQDDITGARDKKGAQSNLPDNTAATQHLPQRLLCYQLWLCDTASPTSTRQELKLHWQVPAAWQQGVHTNTHWLGDFADHLSQDFGRSTLLTALKKTLGPAIRLEADCDFCWSYKW